MIKIYSHSPYIQLKHKGPPETPADPSIVPQ
jgi:hypothetical protein